MKHPPRRPSTLPFRWPEPPLSIVLVEPEIPPNTGNVARLCAATGTRLHLVEPLGFRIDDAKLRRAGLDYWDSIRPEVHRDFAAYLAAARPPRFFLFSAGAGRSFLEARYAPGDALIFGRETRGLPGDLLAAHPDRTVGIPIRPEHVRSLNLSTACGIALFEALRQLQGEGRG